MSYFRGTEGEILMILQRIFQASPQTLSRTAAGRTPTGWEPDARDLGQGENPKTYGQIAQVSV
jgi:hypothetical protein